MGSCHAGDASFSVLEFVPASDSDWFLSVRSLSCTPSRERKWLVPGEGGSENCFWARRTAVLANPPQMGYPVVRVCVPGLNHPDSQGPLCAVSVFQVKPVP